MRLLRFLEDHQLLAIGFAIYMMMQTGSALTAEDAFSREWWNTLFAGHSDDTWGFLLILFFLRKPFREKGAVEDPGKE